MDEKRIMIIRMLLEIENEELLKRIYAYTQDEFLKSQE